MFGHYEKLQESPFENLLSTRACGQTRILNLKLASFRQMHVMLLFVLNSCPQCSKTNSLLKTEDGNSPSKLKQLHFGRGFSGALCLCLWAWSMNVGVRDVSPTQCEKKRRVLRSVQTTIIILFFRPCLSNFTSWESLSLRLSANLVILIIKHARCWHCSYRDYDHSWGYRWNTNANFTSWGQNIVAAAKIINHHFYPWMSFYS